MGCGSMEEHYEDRGDKLRELRKRARITQQELARRADVTQQMIQMWEKNKRALTLSWLLKLAQALGYRVVVAGKPRLRYLKALWDIQQPPRDPALADLYDESVAVYQQTVEQLGELRSIVRKLRAMCDGSTSNGGTAEGGVANGQSDARLAR